MLNYESAFGLRDNPFSPRAFAGVSGGLLDDISGDPLALDEAPALEPLFVPGAGPFQRSLDCFELFLEAGGYRGGAAGGGLRSKAFRVIGPEGSGKSTLTNMLVKRLKDCGHADLVPIRASAEEDRLDEAIEDVQRKAKQEREGVCCVIFDDVRFGRDKPLQDLHRDLRGPTRRPVVMFEIFHHAQDLGVPPPSLRSRLPVEDLRTSWLSGEHAVEFLSSRIRQFRVESPNLVGELATFPFDTGEVAELAGDGDGTEEGPFTLRSFSRLLSRGLDLELMGHEETDPVAELSAAELEARRISVKDLYDRAVEEQIGVTA